MIEAFHPRYTASTMEPTQIIYRVRQQYIPNLLLALTSLEACNLSTLQIHIAARCVDFVSKSMSPSKHHSLL